MVGLGGRSGNEVGAADLGQRSTDVTLEADLYPAVGVNHGWGCIRVVEQLIQPFLLLVDPALLEGYSLASPRLAQLVAGPSVYERIHDGELHIGLLSLGSSRGDIDIDASRGW